MNSIEQLHNFGQSIWYDNIEPRLLKTGELSKMVDQGKIRGVTSNPSIFNSAISKSTDYDPDLIPLAISGKSKEEIYEALAIADIQEACDIFNSLYEKTKGGDGYVSLEVSPYLAYNSDSTFRDAKRLWKLVDRRNLMVKIPATVEGLPAIVRAIKEGININVTLIFSIDRYEEVMNAYLVGLEERLESGNSIEQVASVASFFVSRIDSLADKRLEIIAQNGGEYSNRAKELQGKIAVANAKLAFAAHKEKFISERWQKLAARGGRIQRPLWASTSTKNPAYPDTKYVDELIGPNTVNTIPPKTLEAFEDHGNPGLNLGEDIAAAEKAMVEFDELGVSMVKVTKELEDQGVKAFADAFSDLLASIELRRAAAV